MKKRLKIGIFLDTYYPAVDGVVVVVDNLAKELSKYNDVVVIVPYTESFSEDINKSYSIIRIESIPVAKTEYRLGLIKNRLSKDYKRLVKEKFDIIHIHSPFTIGRLGIRVAKALHVPCIATMHTRFDFEIRRVIKNEMIVKRVIKYIIKAYNSCDNCIAINKAMIRVFSDYGYHGKTHIIYNGTDLKPLGNVDKNLDIVNKKYNLKNEKNVLLFVGRLIDVKNIFFILDVLKLLKEDGFSFKMLYVGTGPDQDKLEKRIKKYKLEDNVILTGRIMDRTLLSAIYYRADLFLFPSLFDASSLVQIEAAINYTPGLFIEGSVTADTIDNNFNGYTTALDLDEYKNRIIDILNNRKDLKKVANNAKESLGKNWSDIALETYDFYLDEIANYRWR